MVGCSICVYVGDYATLLFGVTYAFLWRLVGLKLKAALPTTLTTAARTAHTYDNYYKS